MNSTSTPITPTTTQPRPHRRRAGLLAGAATLAVTVVGLTASPASADPPPELPENATTAQQDFQPAMDYDGDGCYPSVAIGSDGVINGGLNTTGAINGSCHDASDLENSNMYVRQLSFPGGWTAYMYALYFEKDQTVDGSAGVGHRHDWEHSIVWVRDGSVQYVGTTAHGDWDLKPASEVAFEGTHPKVVYHKDGGFTHALRFASADEQPENDWDSWHYPDLVDWWQMGSARDALAGADFGSASLEFKKNSADFEAEVRETTPPGVW